MRGKDIQKGKQYETRQHGIVTVIDCAKSVDRPKSKLFKVKLGHALTGRAEGYLSQWHFIREVNPK